MTLDCFVTFRLISIVKSKISKHEQLEIFRLICDVLTCAFQANPLVCYYATSILLRHRH